MARPRSTPTFSIVIAYEDFATAVEAKRACDFVAANLVYKWRLVSHMWKFELLEIAELRKLATQDAATANLVIIASHATHELPPAVKTWIDMSLARDGGADGLMGLFEFPPGRLAHARGAQTLLKLAA